MMKSRSSEVKHWGPVLREVMRDQAFMIGFPEGISAPEMFDELVHRGSNVATSATVIDVADYMREIYGT